MAAILKNNCWHNIIAKFGCIDPEKLDIYIDTIINFLSTCILLIDNSLVSDFEMAATVPHTQFVWGPILKHICIGHSSVVPNVMIVLQNARFSLSIRTLG